MAALKFARKNPQIDKLNEDFVNVLDFLVTDIRVDGERHILLATEYQLGRFFSSICISFQELNDEYKVNGVIKVNVELLRSRQSRLGHVSLKGFVLDFEKVAWLAIRKAFPGMDLKGCAFHWSQTAWRHIRSIGLADTYMRREGFHSFVRRVPAQRSHTTSRRDATNEGYKRCYTDHYWVPSQTVVG
ncbi:hypothetical protein CHS0354_028898 [Potamilus streckersoni]|uniref:MULE transposase domain-containing protein n=1 Tax=Potamilus streckersoni TaxID=2493646 RepID=A0AAE0VS72_9BIVA|nr:hypothetical protein CHS0354_028898 [Potamilus streckersoni]